MPSRSRESPVPRVCETTVRAEKTDSPTDGVSDPPGREYSRELAGSQVAFVLAATPACRILAFGADARVGKVRISYR